MLWRNGESILTSVNPNYDHHDNFIEQKRHIKLFIEDVGYAWLG